MRYKQVKITKELDWEHFPIRYWTKCEGLDNYWYLDRGYITLWGARRRLRRLAKIGNMGCSDVDLEIISCETKSAEK